MISILVALAAVAAAGALISRETRRYRAVEMSRSWKLNELPEHELQQKRLK